MTIPKTGERMKYQEDGKVFQITKITPAFALLQALDDATQILTSISGLDSFFEGLTSADSRGEQTFPKADHLGIIQDRKNGTKNPTRL